MNTEAKSEIQQIVLPESKLSAKTKSLKSRSYKYDKAGRLVSVVCEACPELNESYVYDKQGNILEKRVGDKTYTYKYNTANQLASMESPEGLREYVYDTKDKLRLLPALNIPMEQLQKAVAVIKECCAG